MEYIEWSIQNEGRGTQFLRYFKGEEGADLRKNMQEYAGYWPRELSGNVEMGIWVDQNLETEVENLFGAGDVVGGFPGLQFLGLSPWAGMPVKWQQSGPGQGGFPPVKKKAWRPEGRRVLTS